ncbi:MAG: hypothetical protein Kow0037_23060 [Calditrichia bacterium]
MKHLILFFLAVALFASGCQKQAEEKPVPQTTQQDEKALLNKTNPVGTYGKGINLAEVTPLSEILASPEKFEGQKVHVRGTIVDVCPKRGCWVELAGEEEFKTIRVKVTDGEIVFPLSAKGNQADVEGVVEKLTLSVKQARAYQAHMAEERGETIDTTQITEPLIIWRIRGLGAEIKGS